MTGNTGRASQVRAQLANDTRAEAWVLERRKETEVSDRDTERVLTRLIRWERRVSAVLEFFDPSSEPPNVAAQHAPYVRSTYGQLRDDLTREAKRLRRGDPSHTEADDRWYEPVIHEVAAQLATSNLSRLEQLHTSLEDVRLNVRHAITHVRSFFEGRTNDTRPFHRDVRPVR